MQKQIKILLTLLTALILAVSCAKNNPNDPTNTAWKDNPNHNLLKKSWYDTASKDSTYNYDGTTFSSSWKGTVSYSFTVEEIVWGSDNTSGIIYGKYTANTYSPQLVGKYYAVSFKSLTAESVSIAGAYKQDGVSATDTLEEAKTTFTEANGYFSQYSDCKVYTGATTKTVYYGRKSAEVNINDQAKLKELWVGLVANQFIYYSASSTYKSGQFDAEGNYHDMGGTTGNDYQNPKPEIRTKYIKNITYEYNGKLYLAGIYWDNKDTGMPNAYRLIIFDETGAELPWHGGGSDQNVIPDENTQWTRYTGSLAIWGYIKNY